MSAAKGELLLLLQLGAFDVASVKKGRAIDTCLPQSILNESECSRNKISNSCETLSIGSAIPIVDIHVLSV